MDSEMTSVYSGGLMYEYSMEANGYGIVDISSSTEVVELDGFDKFSSALSKWPAPTGTGGAASTTHSVACPTSDSIWEVDPTAVPLMPTQAQQYMDKGAGSGPGLLGGSQTNADSGTSPSEGNAGEGTSGKNANNENTAATLAGRAWTWAMGVALLVVVGA